MEGCVERQEPIEPYALCMETCVYVCVWGWPCVAQLVSPTVVSTALPLSIYRGHLKRSYRYIMLDITIFDWSVFVFKL